LAVPRGRPVWVRHGNWSGVPGFSIVSLQAMRTLAIFVADLGGWRGSQSSCCTIAIDQTSEPPEKSGKQSGGIRYA